MLCFISTGIQQKNIVVTTNYIARERNVGKLSYIKDALDKCPDLVLVSGEDLTHYREMSYKVTGKESSMFTATWKMTFEIVAFCRVIVEHVL